MPHSQRVHSYASKKISTVDDFLTNHKGCPITPSELPAVPRIIAIGDLHGDFEVLTACLRKAKVIDSQGNWIGGNTVVVQVGDVLDRGGRGVSTEASNGLEELELFHFLYVLNRQARLKNGRVISLIGNHELMNLIGDFRYASSAHIGGMGGYQRRRELFRPGGPLAKKMACHSLGIIKIGSWVFVHGGLLPEHIMTTLGESSHRGSPLETINTLVRKILLGTLRLDSITPAQESLLFDQNGLFWTREFSQGQLNPSTCNRVQESMQLLGVSSDKFGGMVIGHTPQANINSQCGGSVWRIDTGMSEAFGKRETINNRIQLLEIREKDRILRML